MAGFWPGLSGASPARAAGSLYTALSAGGYHNCAIKTADGATTCWGYNGGGRASPPAGSFIAVGAGVAHTCAIKSADGSIACWGDNTYGQLNGIPAGSFTMLSAGGHHTCAIKAADGSIACWGDNGSGQATPQTGSFTAVSAGYAYTCAIKAVDESIVCWGYNGFGQTSPPTGSFTALSAGESHACAIKTDGSIACWGDNGSGQLNGIPAGSYASLSAGYDHSCAIKTADESIACWGNNDFGRASPPAGSFTAVSAGRYHTCAIKASDGSISCWGDNTDGQAPPPPPLPTITVPADGASYLQDQFVDAAYTCAVSQGATLDSCDGPVPAGQPIDTRTGGSHMFMVVATDMLGARTSRTFHYTVVSRPAITITTPIHGGTYRQGQLVAAAYSCTPAPSASLRSCDGPVVNGQSIDTSSVGSHLFTVIATDDLGQTSVKTVHYTVVGKPTITISAPASGARYLRDQVVVARYSCAAAQGAALTACAGPVRSGQRIDTKTVGSHKFTVSATDNLGSSTSRSASYTVIAKPLPAPVLSRVRQSARRWRRGNKLPKIISMKAPPVGTTFSFTLNVKARVSFEFTRKATGRKLGSRCVAPTNQNRNKPRCTRTITVGVLRLPAKQGANKASFAGRITSTKKLGLGTYTVKITATNADGKRSRPATLTFTIVK